MDTRRQDRIFASLGIASVVVELGGVIVGDRGGRQFATIGSSPAQIAHALAQPAHALVWVGAYLEIVSMGCFLAFALWAAAKLGGGLLGRIAGSAAAANVGASMVALAIGDTLAYRGGKGVGLQLGTALITLNEAVYVCTWFLAAFFLLAIAPMALAARRRALGGSAIAIAVLTFVLTPLSVDNLAQFVEMLWLAWIVYASVALVREKEPKIVRADDDAAVVAA